MKLAGVRVLDLSQFLPGPHLTMTMADHGADVILVEPKNGVGEPVRAMGTRAADGTTVWFRNIARGKRSVALDLKDKADRAVFLDLAAGADVIVEAFRPRRRGAAGHRLRRGRRAQSAHRLLFDQRLRAGGAMGAEAVARSRRAGAGRTLDLSRGLSDGKPNMPNLVAADMAASLTALSAILMALLAREKTGRGERIDIAMYDALLAWTPNITGAVLGEGRAPEPRAMRNYGGQAMNRIYETQDGGFIALAGSEAKFCENLLRALGRLDFLDLAKGEPGPSQAPLIAYFTALFATKTRAEWEAFFEPIDLCWAPVRTLKDAFGDANAAARGLLLHDAAGNPHIGPAIKFAGEPLALNFAVPDYAPEARPAWRNRS